MRLRFEMSAVGGSADDALAVELDTVDLPDEERAALSETVDAVRSGDDGGLASAEAAEDMTYRLQVGPVGHAETVDILYDEATLPVDLLPLIELLRDLAIDARVARNQALDDPPGT